MSRDLFSDVSSDTIGIFGVNSDILLIKILLTSKSPLLTGVLSDFISLVRPFSLRSKEIFPASKKVSIKSSLL